MLPQLHNIRKAETGISVFAGLNRTVNTGFSNVSSNNSSIFIEFKDMKNLSSDDYPQLSTRKCRSRITSDNTIISNLLSANNGLIYIDNTGLFHYGTKMVALENIDVNIQYNLIQYGNNVVILPLRKYINLSTFETTEIDNTNTDITLNNALYAPEEVGSGIWLASSIRKTLLADRYNKKLENPLATKGQFDTLTIYEEGSTPCDFEELQSPRPKINELRENGLQSPSCLYRCVSQSTYPVLIEINDYYVRISGNGIGVGFSEGDYIKIYGMEHNISDLADLSDIDAVQDTTYIDVLNNNYFQIYAADNDYIVIKANLDVSIPYAGKLSVSRVMPEIDTDKMLEVNNRLWACSSKSNEIFCCKQGDCRNWQAYKDGIATDSFAMTVGCEGEFTGIARQNDSIIFFKENWVLKIYGTKPSNYTLATYNVLGVAKGSSKSLVWINGILYYLSNKGVCQYSPGSQPIIISDEAFGNTKYSNAVAGRHENKYYISAQNEQGEYELFVFDTEKGLWHKEDDTQILSTVTYNNTMYYVDGNTGYVMCPDNNHNLIDDFEDFESESHFDWHCETGDLYDSDFNTKYISRVAIGVQSEQHTKFRVLAQFEDGGNWTELRVIRYDNKKPHMIPIAVRRSEFLRLRIEGQGKCNIYGINIEFARGSDKR